MINFWFRERPTWSEISSGDAISQNDEIRLWFAETNNIPDTNLKRVYSALSPLVLKLKYTDMYNDTSNTSFP
jgi:hypothetical protein